MLTQLATAGWGLDWLWPFLLGYPAEKVAVIDEVSTALHSETCHNHEATATEIKLDKHAVLCVNVMCLMTCLGLGVNAEDTLPFSCT